MITSDILAALKSYTENMQAAITFVLEEGEHAQREELVTFLTDITTISEKITIETRPHVAGLRSPMSFLLEADGKETGIQFSGIPSGHEFNSLILAILHASGTNIRLDNSIQEVIKNISEPLSFEVFVSLSCHNCPDIVQSLNQFALLNANISTEMIEGGLFQDIIKARDIQGVPSVYLNGELFATGKVDTAGLIDKLIERFPNAIKTQSHSTLPTQDVTVIGGGPAGVASAIYSARKGLSVTLIADRIGGQVKDTMDIENLISVPKTTGPKLSGNLMAHLSEYDITIKEHVRVAHVEKGHTKKITLSSGDIIETKSLIIATGAKWRELGVPGEKENIGNGVAYCPHCDGPFFKGLDVAVIGGGNSGIEAALDLSGIVKSVTVYEFMPELKADKVLVDKAKERANITIKSHVAVNSITAKNNNVSGLTYQDRATQETHEQLLSGVFVQIGLVPNSLFLGDLVEKTTHGEIAINERCETSEDGIFACGDVTTVPYKQIVIAMGEGSKASLSAFDYLIKNHTLDSSEEASVAMAS